MSENTEDHCNMAIYNNTCPICGSEKNILLTEREVSPFQNRHCDTEHEALSVPKAKLSTVICEDCGFVFNRSFDSSINLYDEHYNNDQFSSPLFAKHIEDGMAHIYQRYPTPNGRILEVGCGFQGSYLKRFVQNAPYPVDGIGFDPSYQGPSKLFVEPENGKIRELVFVPEYYKFDPELSPQPDAIFARHLIEHLQYPMDLLRGMELKSGGDGYIFVETPDVSWTLRNHVWFDFCYEHCSLFSPISLELAAECVGMELCEVRLTFGGQYMEAFMRKKTGRMQIRDRTERLSKLLEIARSYALAEAAEMERCKKLIAADAGKCVLWGAGAKANMLLNMLDKDRKRVLGVVDISSGKWGKFIAGTGHAIIAPRDITSYDISTVYITNPNYEREIAQSLVEMNCGKIKTVCI